MATISLYEKLPKIPGKKVFKTKYKCKRCSNSFAIDKTTREPKTCSKCGTPVMFYDEIY